ncbi:hypothetical protein [Sorangium sp. So ce1024]|uniref:hypothetical protein n=1 Tax=Sorangium sp. So ce1024 TaxID=3133327 RepID=UPI003EFC4E08
MLTDRDILLLCALAIFFAARGEEILRVSERIKRMLGLLPILLLAACFIPDEPLRPGPCRDCHRDCGVLRDDCHARCDEMVFCQGEEEQFGAGGAGEDGFE